jgi:hypothetical protein
MANGKLVKSVENLSPMPSYPDRARRFFDLSNTVWRSWLYDGDREQNRHNWPATVLVGRNPPVFHSNERGMG